jgi:hypothetical protein
MEIYESPLSKAFFNHMTKQLVQIRLERDVHLQLMIAAKRRNVPMRDLAGALVAFVITHNLLEHGEVKA